MKYAGESTMESRSVVKEEGSEASEWEKVEFDASWECAVEGVAFAVRAVVADAAVMLSFPTLPPSSARERSSFALSFPIPICSYINPIPHHAMKQG